MTHLVDIVTACLRRAGKPALTLLFILQLLIAGCSDSGRDNKRPITPDVEPVIAAQVHWQPRTTEIDAVGTSRARQSVTVFPEVNGEVTGVSFSAGQKIEAGQTLVQLDDRDERLAVELAQVQVADAERLYRRYLSSQNAGAVTVSDLDAAKSALEQARIRLQRAQVALDDHNVTAPFSGFVGLSEIDPGVRVTPSTPITNIDDRSQLLVTFAVPEAYHGQLQLGQEVALRTWNTNGPQYTGVISAIDSRIDEQSRTFAVRATVDNQNDQLRPGMSFKVRLSLIAGRYPAVPEIALQWGGDGAFVWSVVDGKAARVGATVVQRLQGKVLVDADLEDGAQVVTEGIHRVREGQAVRPIAPGAVYEQ